MALDKERAKQVRQNASKSKIERCAGRLRAQWTASGNCLHHDYHSLAASVGLSSADVEALQAWVQSSGLRPPRRPRASGG